MGPVKRLFAAARARLSGPLPTALPASSAASAPAGPTVSFTCNLCGHRNEAVPLAQVENRECQSCMQCRSSLRMRALVHLLSLELFDRSIPLHEFPVRKDLRGLGMSDWDGYALALAERLDYANTFYHADPRLDIAAIDDAEAGRYRFLISSDVFEHIPRHQLDAAFRNARRLLGDGGVFLFTVPFKNDGPTREHFPRLHDFRIEERDGRRVLRNRTVDGEEETFEDLVFHGGDGMTLEMRVFSGADLVQHLRRAGFSSVNVCSEHCPEYGILWPTDFDVPIVARA
jgi:hypothetical protein